MQAPWLPIELIWEFLKEKKNREIVIQLLIFNFNSIFAHLIILVKVQFVVFTFQVVSIGMLDSFYVHKQTKLDFQHHSDMFEEQFCAAPL